MKKANFLKLAVALFCGMMMPFFASCGDDDNEPESTTPSGAKAQYSVRVDNATFEGYTVEVEYTDNSGHLAKEALSESNPVFDKGVIINGLPVTVELNIVATPKDKSTLTKDKYDCVFTYGVGAAPVTSSGKLTSDVDVEVIAITQHGVQVDKMKTVTRSKSITISKDGKYI